MFTDSQTTAIKTLKKGIKPKTADRDKAIATLARIDSEMSRLTGDIARLDKKVVEGVEAQVNLSINDKQGAAARASAKAKRARIDAADLKDQLTLITNSVRPEAERVLSDAQRDLVAAIQAALPAHIEALSNEMAQILGNAFDISNGWDGSLASFLDETLLDLPRGGLKAGTMNTILEPKSKDFAIYLKRVLGVPTGGMFD